MSSSIVMAIYLYISVSHKLISAVDAYPRAWELNGEQQALTNSGKPKWLWIWGLPVLGLCHL